MELRAIRKIVAACVLVSPILFLIYIFINDIGWTAILWLLGFAVFIWAMTEMYLID